MTFISREPVGASVKTGGPATVVFGVPAALGASVTAMADGCPGTVVFGVPVAVGASVIWFATAVGAAVSVLLPAIPAGDGAPVACAVGVFVPRRALGAAVALPPAIDGADVVFPAGTIVVIPVGVAVMDPPVTMASIFGNCPP